MNKQGPVLIIEPCGCRVDHGIPTRCSVHSLRSMAEGVSDEEWSRMTEAERWEAVGEQPHDADAYEPGGPGWVHD